MGDLVAGLLKLKVTRKTGFLYFCGLYHQTEIQENVQFIRLFWVVFSFKSLMAAGLGRSDHDEGNLFLLSKKNTSLQATQVW